MINNSFDFIELHKNGNCESVFYAFYGTKWVFGIYKMPFSYNKERWLGTILVFAGFGKYIKCGMIGLMRIKGGKK